MLEFGYRMDSKYHNNISPLQIYMKYVPIINLYHVTKICELGGNIYDTTNDELNDNPLTLYVKQKQNDIDFNEIKQLLNYEQSLITHSNNNGKNAFQLYIDSINASSITFYSVKKWYDLGADPIGMNSEGHTPLEAYIKQIKHNNNDDDDIIDPIDLRHDLQQLCHQNLPTYSRYNAFDIYFNKFKKINCDLIKMWKNNQCIQQIKDYTDFNGDTILIRYIKSHKHHQQKQEKKEMVTMLNKVNKPKKSKKTQKQNGHKKVTFAVIMDKPSNNNNTLCVETVDDELDSINGSSSDTFQMETIDDYHAISHDDDDKDGIDDILDAIEIDTECNETNVLMNKFQLKSVSSMDGEGDTSYHAQNMIDSEDTEQDIIYNKEEQEEEEEDLYDELPFDIPYPKAVQIAIKI